MSFYDLGDLRGSIMIGLTALLVAQSAEAAAPLDERQKALDAITSTADRICATVKAEGSSEKINVAGQIDGALQALGGKLTEIGISRSSYTGVSPNDLLTAIQDANACKLHVLDRLVERILPKVLTSPPRRPSPAPTPTVVIAPTRPDVSRFDDIWTTVLSCPPIQDTLGIERTFLVAVKDGHLSGQMGVVGMPGGFAFDGIVWPDGRTFVRATGQTGEKQFNYPHVAPGRPVAFDVQGNFDGAVGEAHRVEGRPCSFEFRRQNK